MPAQTTSSTPIVIIVAIILGFVGGVAGAWLMTSYLQPAEPATQTPPQVQYERTMKLQTDESAIPEAVSKAQRSVVKIVTTKELMGPSPLPWDFFSRPVPVRGLGSGFLFDFEGTTFCMTNAHVIEGATKMQIELTDGRKMKGEVVDADAHSDLAIVKPVDPPGDLEVLPLGDSDDTRVGEWVIAMGNPFGFQGTITVGVISAKGIRSVPNGQRYVIQTDASINRGNSGGPLVNLAGEVVGINYAIFSPNQEQTTVGIGFAIPVNEAKRVAHFLIHGGPWVGVGDIMPNSRGYSQWAGLATEEGAVILSIVRDSPAARAGLRPGDVLLSVDGKEIKSRQEYRDIILKHEIGDTITFVINRDGERLSVDVEAGRIPQ